MESTTGTTDTAERAPQPLALVAHGQGEGFTAIDTDSHEPVGTVGEGRHPHQVAITIDGRWGYVPYMSSNTLEILDLRSLTVHREVDVGTAPVGAALSRDGRYLFVSTYGELEDQDHRSNSAGVTVLSTQEGMETVESFPIGKSAGVAVDSSNDLWVALKDEGRVARISHNHRSGFSMVDEFEVGEQPQDIAFSPAYSLIGVNNAGDGSVTFINTLDNEVLTTVEAPNPRGGTAVPPQDWWFVSDTEDDGLTVVDLGEVRRGDSDVDTERIRTGTPTAFTDATPDGSFVVADAYGDDRVSFIDTESLEIVARARTGESPHHPGFRRDGRMCYVPNKGSDTVSVLDVEPLYGGGEPNEVTEIEVGGSPSGCFLTHRRKV